MLQYDTELLQDAMIRRGLNYWRISRKANLDPKTVKNVIEGNKCSPDSAREVARVLGFKVTATDLSAILKRADSPAEVPKKRGRVA